jgi:hypothetical protein
MPPSTILATNGRPSLADSLEGARSVGAVKNHIDIAYRRLCEGTAVLQNRWRKRLRRKELGVE